MYTVLFHRETSETLIKDCQLMSQWVILVTMELKMNVDNNKWLLKKKSAVQITPEGVQEVFIQS